MKDLKIIMFFLAVGLVVVFATAVIQSSPRSGYNPERAARIQARVATYQARAKDAPVRERMITISFGAALTIVIGWAAGRAVGDVLDALQKWRRLHPNRHTGLYAIVKQADGTLLNPNEPRAQSLAAYAAASHHKASAPGLGRIASAAFPEPQAPAQIPQPQPQRQLQPILPARAEIYTAPLPPPGRAPSLLVGVADQSHPVAFPLDDDATMLIGGLKGTGKSELVASMIAGLARQDATGQRVQIAIADLKRVDFSHLPADLPLLRWPVALDLDQAHTLIQAIYTEMFRRLDLLQAAHARTLDEYVANSGRPMPYLVGFIDEIAAITTDLDKTRRFKFTHAACEVARMGRSAGVFLVMSTQIPKAEVIPPQLRNLASVRIALRVTRNEDSRAILGDGGAEDLPDIKGRCLVSASGLYQVQAYMAGIRGGRFDSFLASLPRGRSGSSQVGQVVDGRAIPVANWPGTRTDTDTDTPVYRPETAPDAAIPAFSTDDQSAYTPDQIAHIRRLYAQLGSLKAVQRAIYGQDGGYWFYRIREVVTND